MHTTAQSTESIQILVLLIAIGIVTFWRTVLKLMITLATTAFIATLGYGAIMAWQGIHHFAR